MGSNAGCRCLQDRLQKLSALSPEAGRQQVANVAKHDTKHATPHVRNQAWVGKTVCLTWHCETTAKAVNDPCKSPQWP